MLLGISFMLFLLVVGVATVAMSISIMIRPEEQKLQAFRPMAACTAMAAVSSVAAGVALALKNAAENPAATSRLMAGLAESMVPAVVGFALLAVAWLLVSVGLRRLP